MLNLITQYFKQCYKGNNNEQNATELLADYSEFDKLSPKSNILSLYLERDQDLNKQNDYRQTALHIAAYQGSLCAVKELVNLGINVNIQDYQGRTALYLAAGYGKLSIVKYLCELKEINLNLTAWHENSPIHIAAVNGNLKILEYLTSQININKQNKYGETPLLMAAKSNEWLIAKFLIEQKQTNLNIQNNKGTSLLHYAAKFGQLTLLQNLINNHKLDINTRDNKDHGIIYYATSTDKWEIIKWAINNNLNNIMDASLALDCAADKKKWEIVELITPIEDLEVDLMRNNANLLHKLAISKKWDLIQDVIHKKSPDLNLKNHNNKTILDFAAEQSNESMIKFLLDNGAEITNHIYHYYPHIYKSYIEEYSTSPNKLEMIEIPSSKPAQSSNISEEKELLGEDVASNSDLDFG